MRIKRQLEAASQTLPWEAVDADDVVVVAVAVADAVNAAAEEEEYEEKHKECA